jgi:hypothetical protein
MWHHGDGRNLQLFWRIPFYIIPIHQASLPTPDLLSNFFPELVNGLRSEG